jgi:hypothetical protein
MLARASVALKLPTTSMWFRELPTIVRPHTLPRSSTLWRPPSPALWLLRLLLLVAGAISRVPVPRKNELETTMSVIGEYRSK